MLAGLGARLLAPLLPPLSARQMGQILPRPLGLELLRAGPAREEEAAVLGWLRAADAWAREESPP